jgi:hypothetical protein
MSTRKRGLITCQVITVLGLILSLALLLPNPAGANTYSPLNSVADDFVDSYNPNLNNGSGSGLRAGILNSPYTEYQAYLRFDLSGIPSDQKITNISLKLYDYDYQGTSGKIISVFAVSNDTWNEMTLTWNNKPGYNASYQANQSITGTGQYFTWDISTFKDFCSGSDKLLSVVVIATDDPYYSFNFYSREGFNKPYLTVETSPVPLPGALILLGSALLGLLGGRRFRRG